jgi:DNA-binding response OmpR family regulator
MPDRGTLLVLDDDTLTCELVQAILTDEGFHVLIATTGTDALALFRKHAAEIRAVLLDLWMPGLPGQEVLREIHRLRPAVPVILMTAVPRNEAMAGLAGLPVAGFIQKPFSQADLLAKVREVVARSQNP